MSRRWRIACVILGLLIGVGAFLAGYKYGLKQCKPYPPQSVVEVKKSPVKKPVAKKAIKKAPVPVKQRQMVVVPSVGTAQLILRINVVEWAPVFQGKSLASRDIGPVVRQGLANGTVVRTKESLGFLVNGASVSVYDGSAIVDPGPIGPEAVLVVRPVDGVRFASPPNGLPLTTNQGELDAAVRRGASEIWMNFVLAPK